MSNAAKLTTHCPFCFGVPGFRKPCRFLALSPPLLFFLGIPRILPVFELFWEPCGNRP
nr:MAG TPA: hypothetical protein [Caudoviricetes sp.]